MAEFAANRDGKLVPTGYGTTRASAEWVARWTERRVVPQGEAGCWIRLNPTDGTGISDANITAFRVALIEFDEVPLETQLAFFAKIRLPIAALVMSGGKSLHAWVRIGAPDAATYKALVGELYSALGRFGIDPANKNPSRLARLPGARRRDAGARGDGIQKLLYLNPSPTGKSITETTTPTREEIHD